MGHGRVVGSFLALGLILMLVAISSVAGQEQNVGILRIVGVKHPRQVAPATQFQFTVDVEYAVRFNATIRSAIFEGSPGNLAKEIWHSDLIGVAGGGDKVWTVDLRSPANEREWSLTTFAYYLDRGRWLYFNDTDHGPGYVQRSIKIARLANLEIDMGIPGIPVMIDGSNQTTSFAGVLTLQVPVVGTHELRVYPILELGNATRLIFVRWQDNATEIQRSLTLEGETRLVGFYRVQYLLRVDSVLSAYRLTEWYDAGSNVTLQADRAVPMSGPFASLGLNYVFRGWSGQVNSSSPVITFTIDEPKLVNANYVVDYTPLVIPAILAAGVVGAFVLSILRRRSVSEPQPVEEDVVPLETTQKRCENCGESVEETWTHCTNCGKPLGSPEPVQS